MALTTIFIVWLLCQLQGNVVRAFDPSSVSLTTRELWCRAQIQICPAVCAPDFAPTNTCNPTTLDYSCECDNGFSPPMSNYEQTIPSFICNQEALDCVTNNPNSASGQAQCIADQDRFCANQNASVPHVTVTSVANVVVTTIPGVARTTEQVTLQIIEPASVSILSESSSAGSSTLSRTQTPASSATGSSSSQSQNKNDNFTGLLPGAIAGIVIGTITGIAALLALSWYFGLASMCLSFLFPHRRNDPDKPTSDDEKPTYERKELDAVAGEVPRKEFPHEGRARYEAEAREGRAGMRAELEGSTMKGHEIDGKGRMEMRANEPVGHEVDSRARERVEMGVASPRTVKRKPLPGPGSG